MTEVVATCQPPGPGEHPRQPAQRRVRSACGHQPRDVVANACGGPAPAARDRAARRATSRRWRPRRGQDRDRIARRGREGQIVETCSGRHAHRLQGAGRPSRVRAVVEAFEEGVVAHAGEDVPSATTPPSSSRSPPSRGPCGADRWRRVAGRRRHRGRVRPRGLHLSKRLNKDASATAPRTAAAAEVRRRRSGARSRVSPRSRCAR